ncbi:MAG: beta-ketoacyl synthase chain length factor [Salinisphaera sp.]|nr:beta-ketoacyl synthase chain length factor [Salinisphaera sp.]MDN5939820.1 beta-ketoacyl synthase chain length factor [Salinisphaera sp.]
MNNAYVHGIGLAAPGLPDWSAAQPVLRGNQAYRPEPLPTFRTARLPRNEARRVGAGVSLAFRVAEQACDKDTAGSIATVFASTAADISIADRNCSALNSPARAVSPTLFHNSVHNAAAGYWSIATGSRAPAISLSGGRDSFAVALCEAWAMLAMERNPVLLVCFEAVGTGMLQDAWRDIHDSLALALLLSPKATGALGRLSQPEPTSAPATPMSDPALERFRHCNPAARGLTLLTALAGPGSQSVVLESGQVNLAIDVQCSL